MYRHKINTLRKSASSWSLPRNQECRVGQDITRGNEKYLQTTKYGSVNLDRKHFEDLAMDGKI
jgi:hypothetical protein